MMPCNIFILFIICLIIIILYLVYKNYNEKRELFEPVTPQPTQQGKDHDNLELHVQPTIQPTTQPTLLGDISGLDTMSSKYEMLENRTVSNKYDVQNTINPMDTYTMTTIPPVIFNNSTPTPINHQNTIDTALLPLGTPVPTLSTKEIPTAVPTNNFSMPFDTSKHTINYSGMDQNPGYLFGITQQTF